MNCICRGSPSLCLGVQSSNVAHDSEKLLRCADQKWGQAYLTRDFFHRIGETMGEQVLLVVAREGPGPDGDVVAGALNLVGSHAIFGRNWGCHPAVYVKHLHFETCYYQVLLRAPKLFSCACCRRD